MKRIFVALALLMCCVSVVSSCDLIDNPSERVETDEDGQTSEGEESGAQVQHYGSEIEFEAAGVIDENLLGLCWNMTHERRYEIVGLDDCSWARVRHVQNVDGHDNLVYLTVDPNDTGEVRRAEIVIKDENSVICEHTLVQKP